MLGTGPGRPGTAAVLGGLVRREGWRGLLAGLLPRVAWIALGGALFFGVYEQAVLVFSGGTRV
jgi:solute carrier family 25 S-adenosylmethionine transporter 26